MNSEFSSLMTRGLSPPELEKQTNVAIISDPLNCAHTHTHTYTPTRTHLHIFPPHYKSNIIINHDTLYFY